MYQTLEAHIVEAGVIGASARPAMIGVLLSILDVIPGPEREEDQDVQATLNNRLRAYWTEQIPHHQEQS